MSSDERDSGRETRPSLLIRIRDPLDAAAWFSFAEIYAPLIYQYARRRGFQDADAADVTQDVLAEVAHCIRSFEYRPEAGRFRDWLGTVIRRKFIRYLERNSRRKIEALTELDPDHPAYASASQPDPDWEAAFADTVWRAALVRARNRFQPTTWQAFERVWINGQGAAEAAAELGLSIEKVYVAKSRVLKRLEEEVRRLAEDAPLPTPYDPAAR